MCLGGSLCGGLWHLSWCWESRINNWVLGYVNRASSCLFAVFELDSSLLNCQRHTKKILKRCPADGVLWNILCTWFPFEMYFNLNLNSVPPAQSEPSVCHKCNEVIQQRIITALGKTWHPEHFACKDCLLPITEATFNIQAGEPVCSDCFVKLYSGTCHGCKQPILEVRPILTLSSSQVFCYVVNFFELNFNLIEI